MCAMSVKERAALKPWRQDNVIMNEMEVLITDFGFNLNQFVEYACKMDISIFSPTKGALERPNVYQYFKDRPVPLYALWKLANHLRVFEIEIPPEDQRLEEYQDRAKRIQDEVFQYILENRSSPHTLRPVIRDIFKPLTVLDLEHFFDGLYRFSFSERVWAFWLCYACLHRDAQEDILELMAEARIAPKDHTRYLMELHNWERDVNAPIVLKVKKALERYYAPSKNNTEEERRKKLIDTFTDIVQDYPYPCGCDDIIVHIMERTEHNLDFDDWTVLSTYKMLCATLDMEQQQRIDQAMVSYITDKSSLNVKCPAKLAREYYLRFHSSNSL